MADDRSPVSRTVATPEGTALPSAAELDARAASILGAHWRSTPSGGFCVPHASTYPWQWLWDSCFHAVVWAHLGDERAVLELRSVFDAQDPSGFVPHVNYRGDTRYATFWGRPDTSCLTQPPVYGHAARVLVEAGIDPGAETLTRAEHALRHLLGGRPRHGSGLVALLHPWESGADDSTRWDAWCRGGWTPQQWYRTKGRLVETLERDRSGAGSANPAFQVASASFNALLAHDARAVSTLTGAEDLAADADELVGLLEERWDPVLRTWTDAGDPGEGDRPSGDVRTLDALLATLVVEGPHADVAWGDVVDGRAYGGSTGPAGVHRDEPSFSPSAYWRGAAWPQLTYLLWSGARRGGDARAASWLAAALVAGASRSGFAEYWHPDLGTPGGAVPQSWATLAAVVATA